MEPEKIEKQGSSESLNQEFDKLIQEIFIDKVKNISNDSTIKIQSMITKFEANIKDHFGEEIKTLKNKFIDFYTKQNGELIKLVEDEFLNLKEKQTQDFIEIKGDSEKVKLTLIDSNEKLIESFHTRLAFIEMKLVVLKKVALFLGLCNIALLITLVCFQIYLGLK